MSHTPRLPAEVNRREILERLSRSGLLEECRILAEPNELAGTFKINGHVIRLRIRLPRAFPLCLPEIVSEGIEPPVAIPHQFVGGGLCFAQEVNLIDRHDPWGIVKESVLRAQALLRDMLTGNRAQEFAQEIVAYWRHLAQGKVIDCIVKPAPRPRSILALFKDKRLCAVVDDLRLYSKSLPRRDAAALTYEKAVYIPVDPATHDPEFTPKELRSLAGLRKYVQALPEKARHALSKLVSRPAREEEIVVLGVRRPRGARALVGLLLRMRRGRHPLVDPQAEADVYSLELRRRDHAFLAPRGGARAGLRKRRVLVAGCGAVGGYVALALARAGVGKLSLVDYDVFELANTYRHACGMAYLGMPKVSGLKREIKRLIPYVQVTAYPARVEDLLEKQPDRLSKHDLVISVLGHPTIELHLNERLWSDEKNPPALFAWVEPWSLGGHVLLTHVQGPEGRVRGCLECLYHRPEEEGPLENQAAFAQPGVTYTRDMLGCGSQDLPFADLDAQRTAEATVRLALRVLAREVEESPVLSWKGDRRAFEQAGYSVTHRYEAEARLLEAERLEYRRSDCPVCGG